MIYQAIDETVIDDTTPDAVPTTARRTNPWLTIPETIAYLGCSKIFLAKERRRPRHSLPYTQVGRFIRYHVDDLDVFLNTTETRFKKKGDDPHDRPESA